MSVARYSRWDGTQDPLAGEPGIAEALDAIGDDLLGGMDPSEALERLMRRGLPGAAGTRSLLDRLRASRREQREAGRLDGALEAARDRLERIVDAERAELLVREDDDAALRDGYLSSLPESPAGQIAALREYDFVSDAAREQFAALLEDLRREMMSAFGRQMADGMRSLSPEQVAAMKDMLADLNAMIDQRRAGAGPSQEEFDAFMARHGAFFPEAPRTFDELLDALARRAAAMSRLMASLSPEQRAELEALSREVLGDLDLAFEVDRLADGIRALAPGMPWDEPAGIGGEAPLGLEQALAEIERLGETEELERALAGDYPGASLDDVDLDAVRRALGPEAAEDLRRLRRIETLLREAGVLTRDGAELRLTPRGIRRLGERALAKVFERLSDERPGGHDSGRTGAGGELTGQTRPWRWGDEGRIDVRRTVTNAVMRAGPSRNGVVLAPDDFEVAETEARTSVATVLLLDMSFSMPMRGNWLPAKRMALALHALIASKYPQDSLDIVGFSDYAREMTPDDLARSAWEHVYGTNMQHAFSLAGRILSRRQAPAKQVLLVTDGEPTAHLVGDRAFFHWPPVRETLEKTYTAAVRLARSGVRMNIFMLEDTPALYNFVDRLARVVEGRVFSVGGDALGDLVVRDYLRHRGA